MILYEFHFLWMKKITYEGLLDGIIVGFFEGLLVGNIDGLLVESDVGVLVRPTYAACVVVGLLQSSKDMFSNLTRIKKLKTTMKVS